MDAVVPEEIGITQSTGEASFAVGSNIDREALRLIARVAHDLKGVADNALIGIRDTYLHPLSEDRGRCGHKPRLSGRLHILAVTADVRKGRDHLDVHDGAVFYGILLTWDTAVVELPQVAWVEDGMPLAVISTPQVVYEVGVLLRFYFCYQPLSG